MMYEPPIRKGRLHVGVALVALTALVAALVSSVLVGGARSASEASGLIAFTRDQHVYVMNTDGGGIRAVVCGDSVNDVAWSPDGRKLACGSAAGVMVVNADGSGATQVSKRWVQSLSWSSDGARIAFAFAEGTGRRWTTDIAVMNADGRRPHQLTRTPKLWEYNVDWSPGGGRLAFDRGTGMPPMTHVCVMKTDGSGLHDLNPTGWTRYGGAWTVYSGMPDWSPDGRRIAFSYFDPYHGHSDIWIMDADGKGLVKLTENWMEDDSPTWSPDGRRIAFVRYAPGFAETSEIVVMNADGSGKKALTYGFNDRSPAWQPVAAR